MATIVTDEEVMVHNGEELPVLSASAKKMRIDKLLIRDDIDLGEVATPRQESTPPPPAPPTSRAKKRYRSAP